MSYWILLQIEEYDQDKDGNPKDFVDVIRRDVVKTQDWAVFDSKEKAIEEFRAIREQLRTC